jgi:hypothetical protein
MAQGSMAEAPYHTTFGSMYGDDEETRQGRHDHHGCITIPVNKSTGARNRTGETEAIFDTGATGTIIACKGVLRDIGNTPPMVFKGLSGDLEVKQKGTLSGIGRVYYDPRAIMSIISASECIRQGHEWEFHRDTAGGRDAFLLHTSTGTYRFAHRDGLYIGDLTVKESRHGHNGHTGTHPTATIAQTLTTSIVYTAQLPTTTEMEKLYTTREVKRSAIARRFQAALGFPPDAKMIRATRSGTFLNSDILPEDTLRATHMWGPCISGLKGRTTWERPMPPPQGPITMRRESPQHMHCDLMFIDKQAYLVSLTQPAGIYQTSCLDNAAAPILRAAIRKMFGNLNARRIDVVRFTSDNEKGIAALFGDMGGMGVQAIAVGPGQHDHIIERAIRHLKETVRATISSLPFLVPGSIMPHLVVSCTRKIMLFPSTTRTVRVSPFEVYYGRKADAKLDIGLPFGAYCQVPNREMTSGM